MTTTIQKPTDQALRPKRTKGKRLSNVSPTNTMNDSRNNTAMNGRVGPRNILHGLAVFVALANFSGLVFSKFGSSVASSGNVRSMYFSIGKIRHLSVGTQIVWSVIERITVVMANEFVGWYRSLKRPVHQMLNAKLISFPVFVERDNQVFNLMFRAGNSGRKKSAALDIVRVAARHCADTTKIRDLVQAFKANYVLPDFIYNALNHDVNLRDRFGFGQSRFGVDRTEPARFVLAQSA